MLIHSHLVVIPMLIAIAAVFAAAEAALFSMSRSQLEILRETRPGTYRRIRNLVFRPDRLLSTIIIGNECLNIMVGTFIAALVEYHSSWLDNRITILASVLLTSALLLTFSEILPKVVAFRMPVFFASFLVYPLSWAHWILTPLRKVFLGVSSQIIRMFGIRPSPPSAISEKDFLTLVEVGAESGSLDTDERDMIYNVFSLSDLTVSAIMIPWGKIFHLPDTLSITEACTEVRKRYFSRIPVVSSSDGHVVGVLYTKEILKFLMSSRPEETPGSLRDLVAPPHIVSLHKKVWKLFREFKQKKVHFALVVDEFGKQAGVVTLEDVLNALFGRHQKSGENKP